MTKMLSVIVPVFDEENTIGQILSAIEALPLVKEIIVVDDGSTDGTRRVIEKNLKGKKGMRVIFHDMNLGKGAAIRTGIEAAAGDRIIIQDADLEYDPLDYIVLLNEMDRTGSKVVYGSRFMSRKQVTSFWHRSVNYFLTAVTNLLFSSDLTDMETCYKLFDASFLKKIMLCSNGFEIEVELTAKTLNTGVKIVEVPISYKGRSFHDGKKIGWMDGVIALVALFHYRFSDNN